MRKINRNFFFSFFVISLKMTQYEMQLFFLYVHLYKKKILLELLYFVLRNERRNGKIKINRNPEPYDFLNKLFSHYY